ncbi:hypothetical protein CMI45_01100 [Candidatus Pacearchaeota archaeon]|nr:hypothetical protein [Candidatus Pacearchaeota archaeon]|tara:strand:+ start:2104 stop:2463 length:360 start_codon:yes stop_codon:yes gene_type:complete
MPEYDEENLVYRSPDGMIIIHKNEDDLGDIDNGYGYRVAIGQGKFTIPSRCLNDLVKKENDTNSVMESLNAMTSGYAGPLLEHESVDPKDIQIALLHVGMIELDEQLKSAIDGLVEAGV